jgi:hypothetical protein
MDWISNDFSTTENIAGILLKGSQVLRVSGTDHGGGIRKGYVTDGNSEGVQRVTGVGESGGQGQAKEAACSTTLNRYNKSYGLHRGSPLLTQCGTL